MVFHFCIFMLHATPLLLGDEIDSKQFLAIFDRKYLLEEGFGGKRIEKWPPSTELHEFYCERDMYITSRKSDIVLFARRRVKLAIQTDVCPQLVVLVTKNEPYSDVSLYMKPVFNDKTHRTIWMSLRHERSRNSSKTFCRLFSSRPETLTHCRKLQKLSGRQMHKK